MPQGLALHILVAQSSSATKEGRPINNNSKIHLKGDRTERLRGAEIGFLVEIRVLGGNKHGVCLLGKGPTPSCARAGRGGLQFENQGEAEIRPKRKKFVIHTSETAFLFCFRCKAAFCSKLLLLRPRG